MQKLITDDQLNEIIASLELAEATIKEIPSLLAKATAVVEILNRAETQEGGLLGRDALRAANELRLELSRWK